VATWAPPTGGSTAMPSGFELLPGDDAVGVIDGFVFIRKPTHR
jgi:hypothetical protein